MVSKHRITAAFITAVVIVALGFVSLFWFFAELERTALARSHSLTVLADGHALLSKLKDAETGQRGYLLTGDEAFLQPYLAVNKDIDANLAALRALTVIPQAQQQLAQLEPLVHAKMTELAHLIALRRTQNMPATIARVQEGSGKRLMDAIRAQMADFFALEQSASVQREAAFQTKLREVFSLLLVACACVVVLAMLFVYLIHQQNQQRLKTLVFAQTKDLLTTQAQINAELTRANATLVISEEKLSVTLNSIGDAVIATDAQACVSVLNPVAEAMTGWTYAQALGRPIGDIFKIINKQTRAEVLIPVLDTLAHGTVQGLANHTVLIARDGVERDIADSCAPIRDRDGAVVGAVLVFRDVSEDHGVQQALHDSTALIQTILNTVADGIVTLHANDGRIEKVNPAAEAMFRRTAADLHGQNFSILIAELAADALGPWLEACQESAATRASGHGREVTGQRQDHARFPMEIAVSEMTLGTERYFTCILRDITVRKDVEVALVKAGALQNAIFNSANFSSIATDAKGVIQIFNVGAERMLGYAANEVLNQLTPADISDPSEVIARAQALSDELSTLIAPGFEALVFKASRGIEDIYELSYIRKDGSRFPAVVSVTALRDGQNGIIGYLLIGTDNTARKQIEAEQSKLDQRLRDQQFYTRSLIESSIDALMTTDPAGIITDVNKQMEALTGCTRDELIGAPFKNYFTDPQRAEAGIKRVLAENKVINYELTARTRVWPDAADGQGAAIATETVVSYNASTFYDRDRKLQGVFAAARDITERKRLDFVLQENNVELSTAKLAAEKANLAKSDFLSSMSHELRTPLNAILGFAQLLEVGSPTPTLGQQRSIDHILQAGWYLLELINEILDLALIESGKLSLSTEPVKLGDVLRECQAMIEPQAAKRGIRMRFPTLVDALSTYLQADRTRLKQVLVNLLSNAVKYNCTNGAVTLELKMMSERRLRICITDTGAGLSPEKIAQLFQPFNRLGQEANAEEGTGIGLVVSKRLIELMHGSIGVESTVGAGCAFWIELETANAPELALTLGSLNATPSSTSANANTSLAQVAARKTLLYVEDNPANMLLVEEIIAHRSKLEFIPARDAVSGIELARSRQPDVILMDINLPGMSGMEALAVLRHDAKTAHIPVIALSANAIPRDIEKGLQAGFYRYLTKPIKVSALLETLDLALNLRPDDFNDGSADA